MAGCHTSQFSWSIYVDDWAKIFDDFIVNELGKRKAWI